MSNDTQETPNDIKPSPESTEPSIELSTTQKVEAKAMLQEARKVKVMLEDFSAAVSSGTFSGHRMMPLAKGLAFIDTLLAQNKAHIQRLQEAFDGK